MMNKAIKENPSGKSSFWTATDGNNGRTVAWTARISGADTTLFVRHFTKEQRIEKNKNENVKAITLVRLTLMKNLKKIT